LEDPDVVIQGNRVLHLRYRVRRWPIWAGTRRSLPRTVTPDRTSGCVCAGRRPFLGRC